MKASMIKLLPKLVGAITAYKKESKRGKSSPLGKEILSVVDDSYDFEYEENIKKLYSAISQLTSIEKSIILLYLEDKPYEEIAEITGITQNYVRVKMNRIKRIKKKKILIKVLRNLKSTNLVHLKGMNFQRAT
jgi:RNA polymerase sigma-70 factor (ECF subfamily)